MNNYSDEHKSARCIMGQTNTIKIYNTLLLAAKTNVIALCYSAMCTSKREWRKIVLPYVKDHCSPCLWGGALSY
jgi:hypothetical protein